MENIIDFLKPNFRNNNSFIFMDKLCQMLYCFNHKYHIYNGPSGYGEWIKVPKYYKPIIGPGFRDPNRYAGGDAGHKPFSKRENKKEYLDKFIKVYLLEKNNLKNNIHDLVFTKENYKKGQIITVFYPKENTYRRFLIADLKKFFEILNYNPNKTLSNPDFSRIDSHKLYSLVSDATHIPIQDSTIKYIIEISEYQLEPNKIYTNNQFIIEDLTELFKPISETKEKIWKTI